ncbi:GNAT family N-acetyltransferase [Spirochaeta cellobiosiphila]|uniref:GNAT family N-acetyltransferase n=1 Tax=Spirochaeta cellobiosiphila TaxID=504483 RepID=UPI00069CCFEA|nr:GNAT family N-acetyltransferase [Spirochaeta cellobiosiphila]
MNIIESEQVCKYYDLEPFTEISQAEKHIQRWLNFYQEKKQVRFTISKSGTIIGTCGLYLINSYHKRACLGYDLLPEYWGNKGFVDLLIYSRIW